MHSPLGYTFLELEATFYKPYCIVQNDEHVYMVFKVIKQGSDEKVEIYYEKILKLVNGPLLANHNCRNEARYLI